MYVRRQEPGDDQSVHEVHAAAFRGDGQRPAARRSRPGSPTSCDPPAQRFPACPWSRFGFEPSHRYGIAPPDPAWGDYFQVRTLTDYDPRVRGTFRYAVPFDGL